LSAVLHALLGVVAWRVVPHTRPVVAAHSMAPAEWTFLPAPEAAPAPSVEAPPPAPPAPTASRAEAPSAAATRAHTGAARPSAPSATPPAAPAPTGVNPAPTAVPTTVPATPRIGTAASLLSNLQERALAQVTGGTIGLEVAPAPRPSRDWFGPRAASPEAQSRAASAGYVAERLAETHQHEAPGVRGYFWGLRRRMEENWSPSAAREPSLAETALATVAMPVAQMREVQRSAQGAAVEPGRHGAAIDALESANLSRGNNPANLTMTPFTGIVDASQGNARRTRTEVEVLQDEQGVVTSVRVLRSSGRDAFDRAAEHAVREALPLAEAVAMPGGRRSRWSFEVVVSRDPFLPGVGMSFDESTGWVELHWPGRLHARRRVWLEDARPASAPRSRSSG